MESHRKENFPVFYAAIVFILVILFLLKTNRGSSPARYMAAILIFYMMALFWLVLYLSKDMYYYTTLQLFHKKISYRAF